MLTDQQDAYGHALSDFLKEKRGCIIAERDDGYFDASEELYPYFFAYNQWPAHEKKAITYVRGTVLDMGCGAGRHSLYLKEQGYTVTSIDISPLAVAVCKARGLQTVYPLSITEITPEFGVFDTLIMLGNGFGLVGTPARALTLFERFKDVTTKRGRIIAGSYTLCHSNRFEHKEYQEANRINGRMQGQMKLRMHHRKYVTPWFDWLTVSKEEMKDIVEKTGWKICEFIDGDEKEYIAVMEKA